MAKMLVVQQHSVTHPTAFVEKAGITALRECDKDVQEMAKDYQAARDYFIPELDKLDVFSCVKPKGAFYGFPKIVDKSRTSAELVDFLLEKAQVLGVPGSSFGKYGERYIRFVYAQNMDVLKKTIDRIRQATE